MARQHLIGEAFPSPEAVVRGLLAVQSQDLTGAAFSVGRRCGMDLPAVMAAYDRGDIVRTHVLRPTWHFVAASDLRWMQKLTAHRVHRLNAGVHRSSGFDAGVHTRAIDAMVRALEGGRSLSRAALAKVLAQAGIAAEGTSLAYLVMHAELEAVLVSGPMHGKTTTYALASERLPPARERGHDEALAELCVRYFGSHGPATIADCAWWSGLTLTELRRGIDVAGRALERRTGDRYASADAPTIPPRKRPVAHFLSNYDELVVAYRDRSAFFDPVAVGRIGPPERVLFSHLVMLDGVLVGDWKRLLSPSEVVLEARLPRSRSRAEGAAIASAARSVGAFFGAPARLVRV
jgi:hypothetical protein